MKGGNECINNAKGSNDASTTVLGDDTVAGRRMGLVVDSSTEQEAVEESSIVLKDVSDFLNGEGRFGFWSEVRCFFTVWIFLTRLPAPTWVDLHPGYLMKGMSYFPLVGMLIGIIVSSVYDATHVGVGLPVSIASCVCQASSFIMTICFHEDGLGDSADGIGGGWTRDQILKIMTDTRLGTYGCSALILYIVTKIQILTCLGNSTWSFQECQGAGPALIIGHMLSRLTAPWLIRQHPYVQEVGPKSPYYNLMMQAKYLVSIPRVTFATLLCTCVSWILYGICQTLVLLLCVFVACAVSGRIGDHYLGGVMGDYLGATICVTEILILSAVQFNSESSLFDDVLNYFGPYNTTNENFSYQGIHKLLIWISSSNGVRHLAWCVVLHLLMWVWSANIGYKSGAFDTQTSPNPTEEEKHAATLDLDNHDSSRQVLNKKLTQDFKNSDSSMTDAPRSFVDRYNEVREYIDSLAKPVGSLGALEDWAARVAALQKTLYPKLDNIQCCIFAGDHGVAAAKDDGGEQCSAYPQAVTLKILQALNNNMAGASVLAKTNGVASMHVIDMGIIGGASVKANDEEGNILQTMEGKLHRGTRNFCQQQAMTAEEVERCLHEGRRTASQCFERNADLMVIGEVGIGNTTTASALLASLTGKNPKDLCDGGATTGRTVDDAVINRKVDIVQRGLTKRGICLDNPSKALMFYGSAEICGMVGAVLECSTRNKPVLVDGFIATTAAYIATLFSASATRVLFLATASSERGQAIAIQGIRQTAMDASLPPPTLPALAMDLRMGEASAALVAIPIMKSALAVLDISTLSDVMNIDNGTIAEK